MHLVGNPETGIAIQSSHARQRASRTARSVQKLRRCSSLSVVDTQPRLARYTRSTPRSHHPLALRSSSCAAIAAPPPPSLSCVLCFHWLLLSCLFSSTPSPPFRPPRRCFSQFSPPRYVKHSDRVISVVGFPSLRCFVLREAL